MIEESHARIGGEGRPVTSDLLDNWHNCLMIVGRMCSAPPIASSGAIDYGAAPSFTPNDKGQLSIQGKGLTCTCCFDSWWGRFRPKRKGLHTAPWLGRREFSLVED